MLYSTFQSPVGLITAAADATYLRELHIEGDRYFSTIPRDWIYKPQHTVLQQVQKELAEYFNDQRLTFSTPVAFHGTSFQVTVWNELRNIPPGKTVTYRELAARIGKPKAVRAVGTAVGRNPVCIVVPCHRIITSSGGLGGYVAGLNRKQYLLEHESAVPSTPKID